MSSFGFMPNDEAEPIFGQYIQGLSLLAKSEVHFTVGVQARDSFMTTLRRALVKFGDMQKETDELLPVLLRFRQDSKQPGCTFSSERMSLGFAGMTYAITLPLVWSSAGYHSTPFEIC